MPPKPLTRKERLRLEALYKREDAERLANGEFGDYSEHLIIMWPPNDFERNNPVGWSKTYEPARS